MRFPRFWCVNGWFWPCAYAMARDGHGLLEVSPRPAMPYPSTPCRGDPPAGRVARSRHLPFWAPLRRTPLNLTCESVEKISAFTSASAWTSSSRVVSLSKTSLRLLNTCFGFQLNLPKSNANYFPFHLLHYGLKWVTLPIKTSKSP
jgi:hypothetical protein